jgi:DNA replication ATP-dependent helicase Dna2
MLPIPWPANQSDALPLHRQMHEELLDEEVRLQLEDFRQKAESPARLLLETHHELFVALYLRHDAAGHAVLAFSAARGLPRLRDHFQLLLLPDSLARHRDWPADLTYRNLTVQSLDRTEVSCVWHGTDPNAAGYIVAGFRGLSVEFSARLVPRCALALGPQVPPIEYLRNLIQVVRHSPPASPGGQLLDLPTETGADEISSWHPLPLPAIDPAYFLLAQSKLTDESVVLVQGPPGTGKTYLLADLCAHLLQQGQRVLVTALTNRALLEVAAKPQLAPWRKLGKVLKLSLSTDEQAEAPGLRPASRLIGPPGTLVLATFHMASFATAPSHSGEEPAPFPSFDYVLVDEASQALLATLALARMLGRHHMWVGDPAQLPAVVRQSAQRVQVPGAIQGLLTVSHYAGFPAFRLAHTFRLPPRAARYTGLFYENGLASTAPTSTRLQLLNPSPLLQKAMHPQGGPVLLPLSLPAGDETPALAFALVLQLVTDLFQTKEPLSVAVLTHRRATSRGLQRLLSTLSVPAGSVLIVDTVARVQGLTCDVCLYVIPAIGYAHSLQAATFNVATSRARRQTFLIADANIVAAGNPSGPVARFLNQLKAETPTDNQTLLH